MGRKRKPNVAVPCPAVLNIHGPRPAPPFLNSTKFEIWRDVAAYGNCFVRAALSGLLSVLCLGSHSLPAPLQCAEMHGILTETHSPDDRFKKMMALLNTPAGTAMMIRVRRAAAQWLLTNPCIEAMGIRAAEVCPEGLHHLTKKVSGEIKTVDGDNYDLEELGLVAVSEVLGAAITIVTTSNELGS